MQIVAPAGSKSALRAAVYAGADAVYMGLPLFGARAKAENFELDELKNQIDFAHIFGTKVFITLNTLIKDGEMTKALEMAKFAYDCGADAAIVQDIRFIKRLKQELPSFPLHASTQLGIHNAYGAEMLLDMGIRRAVLSRETLPSDIAEIKKTGIEIEFFVHGALCVCFSGNCYFSSLASSYSGNRGKCMQLCRKPYTFGDKHGYFLSAKDICLYGMLDKLSELGVDAVKIEGRMRSDEYVAQTVRTYRSNMTQRDAEKALKSVFNRGEYCSAYLDKGASFNVIYPKVQGNIGTFVGKIGKVRDKTIEVNGFQSNDGDGFKILRNGCEVGGATARNGRILADCSVKPGDELRRTHDAKLSDDLSELSRKVDVEVNISLAVGAHPSIKMRANSICVETEGDFIPQPAHSKPLTEYDIIKSFEKVSEFPFEIHANIEMSDKLFMPVSALNEMRRKAYSLLYDSLAKNGMPLRKPLNPFSFEFNRFNGHGTIVMVDDDTILDKKVLSYADYIAISPRDYKNITLPKIDKPILLNAPIIARGEDIEIVRKAIADDGIYGVISNNLYTLKITDKPILLGTGHNIIGRCDYPHITSFESDCVTGGFIYAFGYAPVMTLCHCPYGKCINCNGKDALYDESGRKFVMRRYKISNCYWQLLNCVPHDLISCGNTETSYKFYDCVGLSSDQILRVLNGEHISDRYTRGNMTRGLK